MRVRGRARSNLSAENGKVAQKLNVAALIIVWFKLDFARHIGEFQQYASGVID